MAYFVEYGVYDVVTHMLERVTLRTRLQTVPKSKGNCAPADTTFI